MSATPTARTILEKGSVVAGNEAIQRHLLKLLKTAGARATSPLIAPEADRTYWPRALPGPIRPEVAVLPVIVFG